jgi:hypothetical protein
MPNLSVALMHYPVVNKADDTIASAVTNLDLHDISRAAKTYGVNRFFVVTPLVDQQTLVERIVSHWMDGAGARYNPKRREAMALIRIAGAFEDVLDSVRAEDGGEPKTVVTSAKAGKQTTRFGKMRSLLEEGTPFVLVFGTAWGLTEPFIAKADYILEPITGASEYNHLSVRSAAAIIFDRLLGRTG